MRGMSNTHGLILAGLLLATSAPAFADTSGAQSGIQAGTSGGVHGDVQIAKADYAPSQRQIGHQIGSGEPIYMGDQIATGAGGGLQVMLLDQTVMTLGQNAKMTVDEMVYDPKSGTGKLNFNVSQGAFRFVSGQIAKANPENVKITTPMATIGIRGTIVGGSVNGESVVIALLGPGGETNTSARHGAIEIISPNGTVDISRTGFATIITPGQPPSPPAPATPEQLQRFGQAGAGSNGAGLATASLLSSDQTVNQTSGSNASQISGSTLANGGAISTVVNNIVTNVQALNKTITDNSVVGNQNTAAQNNSDSSSRITTSLITATITQDQGAYLTNIANGSGSITNSTSTGFTFTASNLGEGLTYSNGETDSVALTSGTAPQPSMNGPYTFDPSILYPSDMTYYSGTSTTDGSAVSVYDYSKTFDLQYVSFGRYEALSADGSYTYTGVYVSGVQTPMAEMPSSGYAAYSGGTTGYVGTEDSMANGTANPFIGTITLTADFAHKTISGSLSNLTTGNNASINNITLASTSISGNGFSGSASTSGSNGDIDTSGLSGTYSGNFYGPGAQEVGGNYNLSGSNATYVNGISVIGTYGAGRGNITQTAPTITPPPAPTIHGAH
jgi:hypothetical protein